MDILLKIIYYVAIIIAIVSFCQMPRYFIKRIKSENIREAYHYEICMLTTLGIIIGSAALAIIIKL